MLNELRGRLADEYLNDIRLQLSEIALLLGYSEQSSFNRAYKQWAGRLDHNAGLFEKGILSFLYVDQYLKSFFDFRSRCKYI